MMAVFKLMSDRSDQMIEQLCSMEGINFGVLKDPVLSLLNDYFYQMRIMERSKDLIISDAYQVEFNFQSQL